MIRIVKRKGERKQGEKECHSPAVTRQETRTSANLSIFRIRLMHALLEFHARRRRVDVVFLIISCSRRAAEPTENVGTIVFSLRDPHTSAMRNFTFT